MATPQNNLGTAILLASQVHEHQFDKANAPYMLHTFEVMRMVTEYGPLAMIVAVLHDALEDEDDPVKRLKLRHDIEAAFSQTVVDALDAMTHLPGEPYAEYIERVAQNYLATVVKIADLTHNMDPRRIPAEQIVDKDYRRWEKYRKALIRLKRGLDG